MALAKRATRSKISHQPHETITLSLDMENGNSIWIPPKRNRSADAKEN